MSAVQPSVAAWSQWGVSVLFQLSHPASCLASRLIHFQLPVPKLVLLMLTDMPLCVLRAPPHPQSPDHAALTQRHPPSGGPDHGKWRLMGLWHLQPRGSHYKAVWGWEVGGRGWGSRPCLQYAPAHSIEVPEASVAFCLLCFKTTDLRFTDVLFEKVIKPCFNLIIGLLITACKYSLYSFYPLCSMDKQFHNFTFWRFLITPSKSFIFSVIPEKKKFILYFLSNCFIQKVTIQCP